MTGYRPRLHERGFTIIEVIIAALILVTVVSALGFAVSSSSSGRVASGAQGRMRDIAERTMERARGDAAWRSSSSCASLAPGQTCTLPALLTTAERTNTEYGVTFDVVVTARAIDRASDQLGQQDENGVTIDAWAVKVQVSIPANAAARFKNARPIQLTNEFDGDSLERRGGLIVRFCAADNQRDERVQFGACNATGDVQMPPCATSSEDCSARDGLAALGVNPFSPLDSPSASVRITPVRPASFTITGPSGTLTKAQAQPVNALEEPVALGQEVAYLFANLADGDYTITAFDASPYVEWRTHSIPARLKVTMERGARSQALVALQRPDTAGVLRVTFQRRTKEKTWTGATKVWQSPWAPTCSGGTLGGYQNNFSLKVIAFGCALDAVQGTSMYNLLPYDGPQSSDRPEECPYPALPSRPLHCWGNGDGVVALIGLSRYTDKLTWSYVTLGSSTATWRNGAAATSELTFAPTPTGRAAIPIEDDGDDITDSYREPLAQSTVAYVGNPQRLAPGAPLFSNVPNVVGRSLLNIRGMTRGLNTIEHADTPDIGTRTLMSGSVANCGIGLWVIPTSGVVPCETRYRGEGECYERLTAAPGAYNWRNEECDGIEADNCVIWAGTERCHMGVLLYRKCITRTLHTRWLASSGGFVGEAAPTTRVTTTCTNTPPLVCTDTTFSACSTGNPASANITGSATGRNRYGQAPVARSPYAPARTYTAADASA